MTVFVDTSALFALLDADDEHHSGAIAFVEQLDHGDRLLTHNYVLLETAALAQARLSLAAVRALSHDLTPRLDVEWVDEETHRAALGALLGGGSRRVSLVDRVSFEIMRAAGVRQAFAFDVHFRREGFATVP